MNWQASPTGLHIFLNMFLKINKEALPGHWLAFSNRVKQMTNKLAMVLGAR